MGDGDGPGDGDGDGDGDGAGDGDGDEALETVIVAADESTEPAPFDTRTQNVDADVSAGVVNCAATAPPMGFAVPEAP